MPENALFTIGYEGLVQNQLLDLLVGNGVQTVLDVRAVPLSRKAGFSKTVLGASLAQRGIAYLHDRRLGTPKPGREAARKGRSSVMQEIFLDHMQTVAAREGLSDAISLAGRNRVCLLCFEREPHNCHRSIVARLMHRQTGQLIRHL